MSLRRFLGPLILGVVGCAALAWLGFWQLDRLDQKERELARIETMIPADPVALPEHPDPEADKYLAVEILGAFDGTDIPVFLSHEVGPIYRLVAAFETQDGRRVLVDRGYVPGQSDIEDSARTAASGVLRVVGNVHWPDEVDRWTPEPDARGVFFGRDVARMASVLNTEPTLIVVRAVSAHAPPATPLPVTTEGIPNNHLGYAVQWFGLALVWAGMTAFLLWRTARRTE